MKEKARKAGLDKEIVCDSAGTGAYHAGEKADPRMIEHAKKRQVAITSIARQVNPNDLIEFDYVVAMDTSNYDNLIKMASGQEQINKILKMTKFSSNSDHDDVPDPYYGGQDGFELVLDILEDACSGLLTHLKSKL